MVAITPTRRSDEQLEFMLYETTNWTVNGSQGAVLCEVASLRLALEKAVDFVGRGSVVLALIRRRFPKIVVLSDQVWNLENRLIQSRGLSMPRATVSVNETIGEFVGIASVLTARDLIYVEAAGKARRVTEMTEYSP